MKRDIFFLSSDRWVLELLDQFLVMNWLTDSTIQVSNDYFIRLKIFNCRTPSRPRSFDRHKNEFFSRSRKDCNVSLKQCVGVIDIAQAGSQSCDICSLFLIAGYEGSDKLFKKSVVASAWSSWGSVRDIRLNKNKKVIHDCRYMEHKSTLEDAVSCSGVQNK